MKNLVTILILSCAGFTGFTQTTWVIDPANSSVQFEVPHLTVSSVTGVFTAYTGTLTAKKNDFENAKLRANIEVASISTNNLERDKHLREADFFNVEEFPEMTFKSTSFEKLENNNYLITGDLTIKEITKPITLEAVFGGIISIDNQKKAGFKAKGAINRFDYGLEWNDVIDSGGLIVGETVDIILNMQLIKQ